MAAIHVEVAGDGPAVVFTHGFADDSTSWAAQVEHFSDRWTTVTWDLPAHGRSAVPDQPGAASREGALAALDEVIAAVEGPVVLVGHSLGGYLSLCRTARDPSGIRALALLASGPGFRNQRRRDEWNASLRSIAAGSDVPVEAAGVAEQPDGWLLDHLGEVTVPALLVVGEHDRDYHAGMDVLAAKLPDAREVVSVPGARHRLHVTHAEAVNALLAAFLVSCSSL